MNHERTHTLFSKLRRLLGRVPNDTRPATLHQLRTTVRRVESILNFYFPESRNHRKLMKLLARVRRRAGRVRDIDVQLAALATIRIGRDVGGKGLLQQTLEGIRVRRLRKVKSALDERSVRVARRRLRHAMQAMASTPAPGDSAIAALAAAGRLGRRRTPSTEDELHAYRMEGKYSRYLAEAAVETTDTVSLIEQLKRMQDVIGEWHDWYLLNRTGTKVLGDVSRHPLAAAISNIARAKFARAQRAIDEARPGLLQMYTTARKRAASEPHPAAGRRTDARFAAA